MSHSHAVIKSRPQGHRCEAITQAERAHLALTDAQQWKLSYRVHSRELGWRTKARYATTVSAQDFCRLHGLVFPPAPVMDPPMSCAHDPDHGLRP